MSVYYASPGDNLTTKAGSLLPGDTLYLNDGTYTGAADSLICDVSALTGTPQNHITIAALHDGAAIIDGQLTARPFQVDSCSYVDILGLRMIRAGCTTNRVTVINCYLFGNQGTGVDHIQVKRVSCHDVLDDNNFSVNSHNFQTYQCTNILFEDCAAWGRGRYMFVDYHTIGLTFRRCWAMHGDFFNTTVIAPRAPFGVYGSRGVRCENCIGFRCFPTTPRPAGQQYTSTYYTTDDTTNWPVNDVQYIGCIFYNNFNGMFLNNLSALNAGQVPAPPIYKHCVLWNITAFKQGAGYTNTNSDYPVDTAYDIAAWTMQHMTLIGAGQGGGGIHSAGATQHSNLTDSILTNAAIGDTDLGTEGFSDWFAIGGNSGTAGSDLFLDPQFPTGTYGNGAYLVGPGNTGLAHAASDGGAMGASSAYLLFRVVNGVPTNTPLWPWPMESRIVSEAGVSPTNDIFKTMAGLPQSQQGAGMGTPQPGQSISGQPVVVTNEPQLAPGSSVVLNAGVSNIGAVALQAGGNNEVQSNNAFWNAAVVGAGGVSSSINLPGYGRIRIFVQTSVADTFNVQVSDDGGTTWYTLTQDNAGTPLIIATTATQLTSARDITGFPGQALRLFAVGAATVTAGYAAEVI
jgi:hypothetical protein